MLLRVGFVFSFHTLSSIIYLPSYHLLNLIAWLLPPLFFLPFPSLPSLLFILIAFQLLCYTLIITWVLLVFFLLFFLF